MDSDDRTNITIDYLCYNISDEDGGEFVLKLYTTSQSNKVYYNLTNAFDEAYLLYVDNIYEEPLYSSNNNISFNQTNPSDTYHSLKKAHYYDIVVDGYIDNSDLTNMQSNYLLSTGRADVNNDGKINYLDRSFLQKRLGEYYV